jgi:hypothetical protein
MDELMIHVERIVRPVRAFASRKLRMRRELLAHLREALDEERRRHPGDEAAAIEEARRRLGEAGELTKSLQKTVPLLERLLMANLLVSCKVERAEQYVDRLLLGSRGRLTPGHASLLALLAGPLAGLPFYMPQAVREVLAHTGTPAHPAACFLSFMASFCLMLLAAFRLVFAAAERHRPLWRARVIRLAAIVLGLQVAFPFIVSLSVADRLPTAADVAVIATVSIVFLAGSMLLSRVVAGLRQPYDPWLMLDVAG